MGISNFDILSGWLYKRNAIILNVQLGYFVLLFVRDTYDAVYYISSEIITEFLSVLFALTTDLLNLW